MATKIGSRRRYQDAVLIYQRAPKQWLKERKMQTLAKDVFKNVPAQKG